MSNNSVFRFQIWKIWFYRMRWCSVLTCCSTPRFQCWSVWISKSSAEEASSYHNVINFLLSINVLQLHTSWKYPLQKSFSSFFKWPEQGTSFLKMPSKQNSGGLSDDRIDEAKEAFSLFDNIGLILCPQALVFGTLLGISAYCYLLTTKDVSIFEWSNFRHWIESWRIDSNNRPFQKSFGVLSAKVLSSLDTTTIALFICT